MCPLYIYACGVLVAFIWCLCKKYEGLSISSIIKLNLVRLLSLQAEAFFKALPASKTPVRGTPGEKYHQKQLIRQLPAHDVDLMYCNELSEEEAKQMELFAKMRKEKCVGRGEVRTKTDGTVWVRFYYNC